ncbi:hypothetical protein DNTS_003649 [Danionella cerebrum]|uniref:PEHE domain-containing protein n=1 Tax=Danionella cerebrum TaxID=2873325 RepID=A0A553RCG1_9TELE|nr:hypothetical protein DNTS_003649 [Danionella translucida]
MESSEKDVASSVGEMSTSAPPVSSSSSARTRPLVSCRRRRLVHPSTVHNLNGKIQRVCFSPQVCDVNSSCTMCGRARSLIKADSLYERSLLERVAQNDHSIHPLLSMQSDVAFSIHLQKVLRTHWQTRPFERIKPIKKISLKHKLSTPPPPPPSSFLAKHKFRRTSAHAAAVRFARHKSRSARLHKPALESVPCVSKQETLNPYRRERVLDRAPKMLMDPVSPCPSLSSTSPLMRQLSLPIESSTPLPGSGLPIRRRRGESPFDINNIVIPMSVAATTRVEKLQYKEILTPRWREVDSLAQPLAEEEEHFPLEDLSDAVFTKLHQPCEDQERLRWRWTPLAPAKRRGSRSFKSLDGRTTPSMLGMNPSSPDTPHFLQDYGAVQSPLSPPSPDTPCSRDSQTPYSQRLLYSEDTCGSASDCTFEEKTVQPWEPRSFPLSEEPKVEPEPEKPVLSFTAGLGSEETESDASSEE